jgi:dolichol-phosphate mannosyltransferase
MERNTKKRCVVTIPTYNEKENIAEVVREILDLPLPDYDLTILVVDDNSPDGTAEEVARIAQSESRVRLLVRTKRRGRGAAGIDGFRTALELHPDRIIEMDGDLSHQPRFIPSLLAGSDSYDIVLGSRFVQGGKDADRNIMRRIITYLVRRFIRSQFHFPVRDVSSGFRCFKADVLERIDLADMISVGPSIVQEVLYKASLLGFKMGEVPITFLDRKKGKTKLSFLTLLETLIMVLKFKKQYAGLSQAKAS